MNRIISQPLAYSIVSMNGMVVSQGRISGQTERIDAGNIPEVIYLLKLTTGEPVKFKKEN